MITERAAERVKTASADATEYLRRLKDQFDHQQQTVAALEEERAIVADKYAKLEIEFIKREKEREKEFRAELQKIVDQFATKAEQFASTIEDAATARKVRKEIERRTIEMKTAASTASRELRQKHGITTQGEQAPAESVEEAAPEVRGQAFGEIGKRGMFDVRAVADLPICLNPVPHGQPFMIDELLSPLAVGAL